MIEAPRTHRVCTDRWVTMLFPLSAIAASLFATAIGISGAAVGLWLTDLRRRASIMVPLSAGLLLGVAVFGLLPELASQSGWGLALALFAAGYGLLLGVDRYIYPVCPTCSHDHDHSGCAAELHGFAGPLVAAIALHCFLDGWGITTVQFAAPLGLRVAVPLAIVIHKAPEGVALAGILLASLGSRRAALGWCILAESATLAGAGLGLAAGPHLGAHWIAYPLGVTAGWLSYLGYHAIHEDWKRRGPAAAAVSAFTGMAGAAAIQRGAEALFR